MRSGRGERIHGMAHPKTWAVALAESVQDFVSKLPVMIRVHEYIQSKKCGDIRATHIP
jgi:hypothetical protein